MTSLALETGGKIDKDGPDPAFLIEQSAVEIGEFPTKQGTYQFVHISAY